MDSLLINFPVSGVSTYFFVPPLVMLLISFFTSMAGISGAFLLLPFQMSVLGFTSPAVNATNMLYTASGTPGGVYKFNKERRLAWTVAAIIVAGVIPGVLIGYFFRAYYLPDAQTFKFLVGLVLALISLRLLYELFRGQVLSKNPCSAFVSSAQLGFSVSRFQYDDRDYRFNTRLLLYLAFGVGILSGTFGIGGGVIMGPLCVLFFRFPIHAIAGAVLLGTFVTSLAGVTFYSLIPVNGQTSAPDWSLGLLFGLGGLVGTFLGAKFQKKFPEKTVKSILCIIVAAVSVKYIAQYF